MSIWSQNRALRGEVQELIKGTQDLQKLVLNYQEVQELLVKDILSLQTVEESYAGNDYREYEAAVTAIDEKYKNKATWGVLQTRAIINLRSAFILGEGLKVSHTTEKREEAARELLWVEDFRRVNNIDGQLDQAMAKEAEIEGKIAIRIKADDRPYKSWPGRISARFVSWYTSRYTVVADTSDYLRYKELKWPANSALNLEAGKLEEPEFVYAKFGGRLNEPNEAQPTIMGCLTQIDRLDRALRDLREIDHLFSAPTPVFACTDKAQIAEVQEYIKKTNWKIGKVLILAGVEFSLVVPDIESVEILIKEIELLVKMISGVTGIPIHYLGLLDLLKNRATGENTRELIMAATTSERQTRIGVYEELFTKAMELHNATYEAQKETTRLDPTRIKVDIPQITQEHWDRIERVFIPAALGNIISREAAAEQIPGIDVEAETKRREDREAKEAEAAKEEAKLMAERIRLGGNERSAGNGAGGATSQGNREASR